MQIKTTMRYYLTPIRMAIIKKKKLQTINLGQDVEKENPLHGLWECKLIYPLWRTVWRFLNKLGITLPCVCLVTQSCPTLCDPMDCSLPGSSVHGILQARILEWIAMPSSRESFWPRNQTGVSHVAGRFFTSWATREAHCQAMVCCKYICLFIFCLCH